MGTSTGGGVSSWQDLSATSGPSPPDREGGAFAYDAAPGAGYAVLYGGQGSAGLDGDTWIFQNGVWRNATATACATACPPRMAFASMAYDPVDQSLVLAGGLSATCAVGCNSTLSPNAYLWTNGAWRSAVPAPYYALDLSLAWDSVDRALVAFGGTSSAGPTNLGLGLGETAFFNATAQNWSLLSGVAMAPSARWGAAMTNLSTGAVLLFGGDSLSGPLNDSWEFYGGAWDPVHLTAPSPPARAYAALEESPAAALGVPLPTDGAVLFQGRTAQGPLGDTWAFSGAAPTGGVAFGNWSEDVSLPSPPPVWGAAATTDLADGYVVTFSGDSPGGLLGSTWAYFHPVVVLGAAEGEFRASTTDDLVARAAGGLAPYSYAWSNLPSNCSTSNVSVLACTPTGFGIYDVSVGLVDARGRTASANLTIQVDPESTVLDIASLYQTYFYTGVATENTFGVTGSVWGALPQLVNGTLPGVPLNFTVQPGGGWNASAPMGDVTPGGIVRVTLAFANWTVHGSLPVSMIETPSWMGSFLDFPGNLLLFEPSGSSEWNRSYSYTDEMGWSLASLLAFSLPVPGFSGAYALLPTSLTYFQFSSAGSVAMTGQVTTDPSLSFGPVTISASIPGVSFSTTINVTGSFSLQSVSPGVSTIAWNSASAMLSVSAEADFTISIFPAATPVGSLGLSAVISVSPSIMVSVILGPGSPGNSNFLPGLDVVLKDLVVALGVQVGLTIQVGVSDLFEIGAKGTLGLEVLFQTLDPHLADVWVNASVSGFVQFLCFSVSFTLWSGTIYQWSATPSGRPVPVGVSPEPASLFVPWSYAPRYYNTSSYDRAVWTGASPNGTAIEDVYPHAAPVASGAGGTVAIAYTTDHVGTNQSASLGVEAYSFDPVARTLVPSSIPAVPLEVSFSPQVLGLPDGRVSAVFSTVPIAAMASRTPGVITGFGLETSTRTGTAWSPPALLQDWGFPLSYVLDTCGAASTPTAAVLVGPSVNPVVGTPERLLEYDLDSLGVVSNASVTGLQSLSGFDCQGGWVSATGSDGNATLVATATGLPLVVNAVPPVGSSLVRAVPVLNASADAALLYRGPAGEEAIVFALQPQTVVVTATVPSNVTSLSAAEVAGTFYLAATTPDAILPYAIGPGGAVTALRPVEAPGLEGSALARTTYGLVVLAVPSTGGATQPVENLTLSYVPLASPPAASGPVPPAQPCTFGGAGCGPVELALGVGLGGLLLATAVAVLWRRTPRDPVGEPTADPNARPPGPPGVGP